MQSSVHAYSSVDKPNHAGGGLVEMAFSSQVSGSQQLVISCQGIAAGKRI